MIRRFERDSTGRNQAQSRRRLICLSRFPFTISVTVLLLLSGVFFSLDAATLPTGFVETQISGLSSPTAMDFAPDGRLFVCLQGGDVRIIKNGVLLPAVFLHLDVDSSGERGLLGIAFDPNFASNNFLYLYYTVLSSPRHNRVSRFTANGDVVGPDPEFPILDLENLSASNHNGGAIHFGPDGKLYIAVGENAVPSNAQTLANRLGKILRINSDGTIPTDNPFFNTATGDNRVIWALGLRNPFTFAFQPGSTPTRMFINDVGQSAREEINDGIAASNYGWSICEGLCSPPNANFRDPLFEYGHGSSSTTGCAITGGAFYNPTNPTNPFPASYVGKYFFADLCTGWIRLLDPSNNTAADFATGIANPVDLKVAADGSLYYLAFGSSSVFRVQYSPPDPAITMNPSSQTVTQGQPVTFNVAATGSTPLSYQWQRNMVDIAGATSQSYTISSTVFVDNGAKFRCVVTNAFGTANSNEATLTVTAPPGIPPGITTHPSNQTVTQGQPVTFNVAASGDTPLSYQWQRDLVNISGANSPSFTISATALADNSAKFRCVVSNSFGTATSNEATLTVQPSPPIIQIEENTDSAIAFDSVTMFRDPFPLTNLFNFSSDNRTRIVLFAANLDLLPSEDSSAVTARAEDAQLNVYPMTIEFVGKVPNFEWLTQVIVRLPDNLPTGQDVLVSITLHGQTSNKVRLRIK